MIPELWQGQTVFILGGGPSLSNVNFDLIKGRRVLAVNNSYGDPVKNEKGETICYEPRHWVDAVWYGDVRWLEWHKEGMKKFSGLIGSCASGHDNKKGIIHYKRGRQYGLEKRRGYVAWNRSSGASAIDFAFHLGAKTVVLLGYDMRRVDGKKNWHDDHKSGPPNDGSKDPYDRFLIPFQYINRDARERGFKIINCTPDSAIQVFPIMSLEDYLKDETDLR